MSEGEKKCYLKSLQMNIEPILLPDSQEISLGRSPVTYVRDLLCSRRQVSVMADYETNKVLVRHLGGNPSGINGRIFKNETHVMKHGDVLEFLEGQFPFKLEFTPAPDVKLNGAPKRSHETVDDKSEVQILKKERKMEGQDSLDLNLPQNSKTSVNSVNGKKTSVQESVKCISAVIGKMLDSSKQIEEQLGPPQEAGHWSHPKSGSVLVYTAAGVRGSSKIAAYDMDGTLILTKSGRVFPKDMYDWQLAFPEVKSKLSQLSRDGYKIVIITNQGGIGTGRTKSSEFKSKIEKIGSALNVPIQVFIATVSDIYRKPAPGIWSLLANEYNSGIDIDMKKSFYVGDAAGRIVNWAPKKKKDFSCSDRLFAMNLKLNFYTPEEHFLNQRSAPFNLPAFIPSRLDENQPISSCEIISKNSEVVILVGYPASGKSYFASQYLISAGYVHVNRDTLGSWQRCVSLMESSIKSGSSVVVDNTNPDRESRKRFIDTAKALKVPCRCFVMSTDIDHAKHNNRFRELTDKSHVPVSEIIINNYKNKFQKPTLDEGFVEIVEINFVPKFSDPELRKLYMMFLLEK